jgi:hypothetical protein
VNNICYRVCIAAIIVVVDYIYIDITLGYAVLRDEIPIVHGRPVTFIIIDSWAERCPSIVAIAVAPSDPGRCPGIARDPNPAIARIHRPPAIVKGCPAPAVI